MINVGFYTKYYIGSLKNNNYVVGDELYATSLCRKINKFKNIHAKLYSANNLPQKKIDLMIYLDETPLNKNWASKHVLYLQDPYKEKSEKVILKILKYKYDAYIFVSKKLYKSCKIKFKNKKIFYFPFCVDTKLFFPEKKSKKYSYDVVYVGNNIKDEKHTAKYLLPPLKFNFGLFGGWNKNNLKTIGQKNELNELKILKNIKIIVKKFSSNRSNLRNLLVYLKNIFKEIKKIIIRSLMIIEKQKQKLIIKLNNLKVRIISNIFDYSYYNNSIFSQISRGKISQACVRGLYNSSKICLNFTALDHLRLNVITLRTLEILACKGFVITDAKFIDSEHSLYDKLVVSSGNKDLEKKITYYLKNKYLREKMAKKGYKYVIKYANMDIEIKKLINIVRLLVKKNYFSVNDSFKYLMLDDASFE